MDSGKVMSAKSEQDAWQSNVSDQVHVFIIGATGSCSEFNGNFHLDLQERGPKSCSWELPFVPKQQLFRAVFVANQTKNSTFEVWFKFEGSVQGPVWTALDISDLSNTILLKLNPDAPADKAITNGWPQHIRVSFANPETAQKTFYIPPELNEDSMAMLSSLGALGNSGGCPEVYSVTGSGGAQQSTDYPGGKQTSFTCNATNEIGAILTASVSGVGGCGLIVWEKDGASIGDGCSKTFMPPYSNRGAIVNYRIKCKATSQVLWSGAITFTFVSGPTNGGPGSLAPGDQPKTGGTVSGNFGSRPSLPNAFGPSIFDGLPEDYRDPEDISPENLIDPCEPI